MRSAFLFTTLMMALAGCDLFAAADACATDDDCDGRDRCEDGGCVTPRRDRDDDDDGGEGEGEGEGEPGEGEGEGEGENPIEDVIVVAATAIREPVTCAGARASSTLTITANAELPAALPIEVVLADGVTTDDDTAFTLLPGSTVTLALDVELGFVERETSVPVEVVVAGAGTVVVAIDVDLFADSVSVVDSEAPATNDVLLIVENSGSMTSVVDGTLRNEVLGSGGFVDDLFARGGVALRVAVIDAGPSNEPTHGVARRCAGTGSGPVLTTANDVRCAIETNLWDSFNGSGTEEYLAPTLAWFGARNAENGAMLRAAAHFTVVVLADSEDQGLGSTSSTISTLQGLVPARSSGVTMHALRADGEGCNTSGNTNVRLDTVVDATGGTTGDICNAASRATFFNEVLTGLESSSSLVVADLPATGEVVVCVEVDDVCTIVADAIVRVGDDEVAITAALPAGALRVLTAPACSLP